MDKIQLTLKLQNSFFNPRSFFILLKKKPIIFQFIFKETVGIYKYYIEINNGISNLHEGESDKQTCLIETDIDTFLKVGGGYTSPLKAIFEKKLLLKKGAAFFIFGYGNIFCGRKDYPLPENVNYDSPVITEIKKVVIFFFSPRKEKGVTWMFSNRLVEGMKKAGAEVEIIKIQDLKISPCISCFKCFHYLDRVDCIHYPSDDMKIVLEKYFSSDLIVWAVPLYFFYGTSIMKIVIDRFISIYTPFFYQYKEVIGHLGKRKHYPPFAILSVGGFHDYKQFKGISIPFKEWGKHNGQKILSEIFRTDCMAYLLKPFYNKKMDDVLNAVEDAGYELINKHKVTRKTMRRITQKIISTPMYVSAGNSMVDVLF